MTHLPTCPMSKASTTVEMAYADCICGPYLNAPTPRLVLDIGVVMAGTTHWWSGGKLMIREPGREVRVLCEFKMDNTAEPFRLPTVQWVEMPVSE